MLPLNLFLDALTLFILVAYVLSAVVALFPTPAGTARWRAGELRLQLLFPLLGAFAVVALGLWHHVWPTLAGAPVHGWPHLHQTGVFGTLHGSVAVGLLAAWSILLLWSAYQWGQARGRLKLLEGVADPGREPGVRRLLEDAGLSWPGPLAIVSFDLPICFVYGVRTPRLLLSTAVVELLSTEDLRAIVAHELAHVSRRDNLWRLIGRLAILTHLPGLGQRAFRRWAAATESACDEAAALQVGSHVAVAEALVRYQRLLTQRGVGIGRGAHLGAAFEGAGSLEARVALLLAPPAVSLSQRLLQLWPWTLLGIAIWQLERLHHGLEALLRLLHL